MPELVGSPEWPSGIRGRVLVEATEWGAREMISGILQREGYATVACPGPEGAGQRCSLAAGHGCGAAEAADVVVHALRSTDARNREALRALRQRLPDTPVVVEAPRLVAERLAADYERCIVIDAPLTAPSLLDAVDRALRSVAGEPEPDGDDEEVR